MLCGVSGGESAYFKIMPRFKIHSEGDCVSADDKVVLMSVKGSRRVHLSSSHALAQVPGTSGPPMIGASAARRLEVTASHVGGTTWLGLGFAPPPSPPPSTYTTHLRHPP
jgi:hypothetical protein